MTGNTWDAAAYDTQFGFVGRYGDAVLALLDPQPGERILDLGCGTGRHAADMAALGAVVVGLDADEGMLATARAEHPEVAFVAADAGQVDLSALGEVEPFDACFSNAALHWMTPQSDVLNNVHGMLASGARFVAEMGGAGNIAVVDASLRAALVEVGMSEAPVVSNYFPTIGVQSAALELAGFRVEMAVWFRRPTPLDRGTTVADWTRQFRAATWAAVPDAMRPELTAAVDRLAAENGLQDNDTWHVDYCRLRFIAVSQ